MMKTITPLAMLTCVSLLCAQPVPIGPDGWIQKYFPRDAQVPVEDRSRALAIVDDPEKGPCLAVGPWHAGVWALGFDSKASFPSGPLAVKGFYRSEGADFFEIGVGIKYRNGEKELSKLYHSLPPAPRWTPFSITRLTPYPGSDNVQLRLGLIQHTSGKVYFSGISVEQEPPSPYKHFDVPLAARNLSFAVPSPGRFYRLSGNGDTWTLVAPNGKPFYSLGSMVPYREDEIDQRLATLDRIRGYGYNTVAGWISTDHWGTALESSLAARGREPMPMVHVLETSYWKEKIDYVLDGRGKRTAGGYPHSFPDPFSPRFRDEYSNQILRVLPAVRGKTWFLGWMQDNEAEHGELWRYVHSEHCAPRFMAFLAGKYAGRVEDLNRAWGTSFPSFSEIRAARYEPPAAIGAAYDDYFAFSRVVVKAYVDFTFETLKALDPDHLLFSDRFHVSANRTWYQYLDLYARFDAIAVNLYPANFAYGLDGNERGHLERVHRLTRKPLLITEWSVPAVDSGLYDGAGKASMDFSWPNVVPTQSERAAQAAIVTRQFYNLPYVVGSHWFMYRDADDASRRANRGIMKADGTPWTALIDAMKGVHEEIQKIHR